MLEKAERKAEGGIKTKKGAVRPGRKQNRQRPRLRACLKGILKGKDKGMVRGGIPGRPSILGKCRAFSSEKDGWRKTYAEKTV